MRKGDTKLKDQCRYLVRRASETFLEVGKSTPQDTAESATALSQEELLHQPVYIPHRPKKDPRELTVLDPACGSGHFLLYSFDVLRAIYEEAYNDAELGPALKKDYPTLNDLRRAVPGLILSHNLHGIDIDLRATQIAALTLWLRAQRAYQEMEIKGADRPKITRSNIVCAEPMPGEQGLLEEFVTGLQPTVLGQLVRAVFARMSLAGEAGSLLKIAEDMADTVTEAKKQWLARPKVEQLALWPEEKRLKAEQLGLFDVSGITDEDFWHEAEARVLDTLHAYARHAANGTGLQRQLFTEDTIHGFAFIDLCSKRFDVVLMNPPFGEASKPSKLYIATSYPRTKNDVYAAFVERGLHLLERGGMLGAITSRTGFFLRSRSGVRKSCYKRPDRRSLLTLATAF
jgi:hypothetical protein